MWASSLADDLQDVIERAVQIGVKKVTFHFCYYLKNETTKFWLKMLQMRKSQCYT